MVMIMKSEMKKGILQFLESLDSLMALKLVRTMPREAEREEDADAIAEFLLEKFSEIEDYDIKEVDAGWVILLWGKEPYDEHLLLVHSLVVLKAPLKPAKSWLVVGCQPLSENCLAQYRRGYYWPQYIGGQVELAPAPRLEEHELEILYEGVELTVNAPSFPMPDWVDFELSTIIVRGEDGVVERLFVIDESDEESVQNWQIWYDSGYSDTDPEEE
jgi:hypothetical protein